MKKIIFAGCWLTISLIAGAQTPGPVLYGSITKNELLQPPFRQWFDSSFRAYQPSTAILAAIRKLTVKDITLQVFMGTWCGDSRRETPRLLRIVNDLGWADSRVKIIAVGGNDSLYKQSPQHEEAGLGIFRVPAIIVYKNGTEINRITEFAAGSLERDLLTILSGQAYDPNYHSFAIVRGWLADGSLLDKNTSTRGLAMQVRSLVANEHELSSLGYVLLKQDKKEEALRIFQVNTVLYPESANVISSLGEGYLRNGDKVDAINYLERAIELNKDPKAVKDILKLLYEAKSFL